MIEFVQFLRLLQQKKVLILILTALPTLTFGLWLYFSPRAHAASLSYAMELTATDLERIANRFYAGDNLDRLTTSMEAHGLSEFPQALRAAESEADLREKMDMVARPNYVDFNKRENLKLSLERSWAENVAKLEELRARILQIHLHGGPAEEVRVAAMCIRHNLEQQLPLQELMDGLLARRFTLNSDLADLEQNRSSHEEYLARSQDTLIRLKSLDNEQGTGGQGTAITLDFKDLEKESRYLPLGMQREVFAAQVATTQENLASDLRRMTLMKAEAALLDGIIEQLKGLIKQGQGLEDYLQLLGREEAGAGAQDQEWLRALHRRAENYRFSRRPLVGSPRIVPLAKNTLSYTFFGGIAFGMIALLIVILAWLMEQDPNGPKA